MVSLAIDSGCRFSYLRGVATTVRVMVSLVFAP